jgi:hypothetical protein
MRSPDTRCCQPLWESAWMYLRCMDIEPKRSSLWNAQTISNEFKMHTLQFFVMVWCASGCTSNKFRICADQSAEWRGMAGGARPTREATDFAAHFVLLAAAVGSREESPHGYKTGSQKQKIGVKNGCGGPNFPKWISAHHYSFLESF